MNQPEINQAGNTSCVNVACKTGARLRCSACKKAEYCSKKCQKQHWKDHKSFCKHVTSNGASSSDLCALTYYKTIAVQDPKVQYLAKELGLTLVDPDINGTNFGALFGLKKPLHRLAAMGKDTPENLTLFFGSSSKAKDEVKQRQKETRIDIFIVAPPGSPRYWVDSWLKLEDNCPSSTWTPREASAEEEKQVAEVRDMQEKIRQHMGSRGMDNTVTRKDMADILVANFGSRWEEMIGVCKDALGAMDQGVHVR